MVDKVDKVDRVMVNLVYLSIFTIHILRLHVAEYPPPFHASTLRYLEEKPPLPLFLGDIEQSREGQNRRATAATRNQDC